MSFAHDPDLDPIKPPAEVKAATPAAVVAAARPVITPADPRLWSTVVPLTLPLMVDGELLSEVVAHRPSVGDIAALLIEDGDERSLPFRLRARMCRLHPDVLASLWADDGEAVAAACRPFLPRDLAALQAELEAAADSDARQGDREPGSAASP